MNLRDVANCCFALSVTIAVVAHITSSVITSSPTPTLPFFAAAATTQTEQQTNEATSTAPQLPRHALPLGVRVVAPLVRQVPFAAAWFGKIILNIDATSSVVYVGTGCAPLDVATVSGKFVLVDRGECSFSQKARWAQFAGSLAMIVANDSDALFHMTDDGQGGPITLLCLMIRNRDGAWMKRNIAALRLHVGFGLPLMNYM